VTLLPNRVRDFAKQKIFRFFFSCQVCPVTFVSFGKITKMWSQHREEMILLIFRLHNIFYSFPIVPISRSCFRAILPSVAIYF
jgi:hypothetical protein